MAVVTDDRHFSSSLNMSEMVKWESYQTVHFDISNKQTSSNLSPNRHTYAIKQPDNRKPKHSLQKHPIGNKFGEFVFRTNSKMSRIQSN